MKKDICFPDAIECFYSSLADLIRTRIEELGLTRADVLPSDPKRVTAIVNNRRDKNHPYLIGAREYNKIHNIFKFHTKKEVAEQGFDENEFIQVVEEYEVDKRRGTTELIQKEKFFDPNNYDDMLWGHIDWEKIFHCIIKNIQDLHCDDKLYVSFRHSLLDYVPYAIDAADFEKSATNPLSNFFLAEPPVYFPFEVESPLTGETEIQNELLFGDEIFNQLKENEKKAIEWVYMKEKQTIITNLKKEFLHMSITPLNSPIISG